MEKNKKEEQPKDMATALDYAIRDFEVGEDISKYGYKINKIYNNYMSNDNWESFKNSMPEDHRNQFKNGSGGELEEKKGRWGKNPPKMASFGSSSRMIYELSKGIPGFSFEKELKLGERFRTPAYLDGFIKKGNKYIYVEAKRREIYYSSHVGEEIKEVYIPVYKKIRDICGEEKFKFDSQDAKDGKKKVTFYLNGNPVQYFDLKQLISHFLGITYDLAKHNIKDAEVKFVYLIYNPEKIEINKEYQDRVMKRYGTVVEYIKKNKQIIKDIFNAVLEYQKKTQGYSEFKIKYFEFVLADQKNYIEELN